MVKVTVKTSMKTETTLSRVEAFHSLRQLVRFVLKIADLLQQTGKTNNRFTFSQVLQY